MELSIDFRNSAAVTHLTRTITSVLHNLGYNYPKRMVERGNVKIDGVTVIDPYYEVPLNFKITVYSGDNSERY